MSAVPFVRFLRRLVFGDDIFISYSRSDGVKSAIRLARHLKRHKLTFYLDRLGSRPGRDVPPSIERHVRSATMMVVICTPGAAANPQNMQKEIGWFHKTDRDLHLLGDVDSGRTLVPGLAVLSKPGEIVEGFTNTRLMVLRRRFVLASTIVFLIAGGVAYRLLSEAYDTRKAARQDAEIAKIRQRNANQQADRARRARDAAEKEARRQSEIALARQLANEADALDQQPLTPVRAVLLTAVASLRQSPTPAALGLAQGLAPLVPKVVATHRFDKDVTDAAISRMGEWSAAVTGDEIRIFLRRRGAVWRRRVDAYGLQRSIEFSPDESRFLYNRREEGLRQSIHVLSLDDVLRRGNRAEPKVIEAPEKTTRFFFSRDGKEIVATSSWADRAHILPLDGGATPETHDVRAAGVNAAWIVGYRMNKLTAIPRGGGPARETTCAGDTRDIAIAGKLVFSTCVVTGGPRMPSYDVRSLDLDSGKEDVVYTGGGAIDSLDANPDGSAILLVTSGRETNAELVLVDTEINERWRVPLRAMATGRFVADGTIAVASGDHASSYRDATNGHELARWSGLVIPSSGGRHAVVTDDKALRFLRMPAEEAAHAPWALTNLSRDGGVATSARRGAREQRIVALPSKNALYSPPPRGIARIGPAARVIAVQQPGGLRVVDVKGRALSGYDVGPDERIGYFDISGDDRRVAMAVIREGETGVRLVVMDVRTGKTRQLPERGRPDRLTMSSGGAYLATLTLIDATIESIGRGKVFHETVVGGAIAGFTPDDSIAVIATSGHLTIVDLAGKRPPKRIPLEDTDASELVFRADGSAFFVIMRGPFARGGAAGVYVFNRDGERLAQLFSPWPVHDAVWVGDESILLVDGSSEPRTLTWDAERVIRTACDALARDPLPLSPDIDAKLHPRVREHDPCAASHAGFAGSDR
jgi:hypothetical protein